MTDSARAPSAGRGVGTRRHALLAALLEREQLARTLPLAAAMGLLVGAVAALLEARSRRAAGAVAMVLVGFVGEGLAMPAVLGYAAAMTAVLAVVQRGAADRAAGWLGPLDAQAPAAANYATALWSVGVLLGGAVLLGALPATLALAASDAGPGGGTGWLVRQQLGALAMTADLAALGVAGAMLGRTAGRAALVPLLAIVVPYGLVTAAVDRGVDVPTAALRAAGLLAPGLVQHAGWSYLAYQLAHAALLLLLARRLARTTFLREP